MTWRVFAAPLALGASLAIGRVTHAQVPAELRGRITDAGSARPIAGARVDVVGRADAARSDLDGAYVLRGLEPRSYQIRVRAVGYAPRQLDVEIVNGRTTTLDVALDAVAVPLAPVVVRDQRAGGIATATTFDRAAIEASHRRDAGELLATVPGVVVTQTGGPGSPSHVSIRGSSAGEVLVLIDGVAVSSALGGDADLSRIPLETVERVTVVTGAQSARYGARALAGVVAIDTRRPVHEASILAGGGAWGERSGAVALGETRAAGSLRLGGSLTTDYRTLRGDFPYSVPAIRGGGTAVRANAGVTSRHILATSSLDGRSWTAIARGAWEGLSRGLAGSIVQPSATGHERQNRASVGADAHGARRALSWTVSGNVTRERAFFADTAPPFGTKYDDTVRTTAITSSASATLGRDALAASAGAEVRALDVRATQLGPDAPHGQQDVGAWTSVRASRVFGATTIDAELAARADRSSLVSGTTVSPRAAASISRGAVVASFSLAAGYAPPSLADQFFHEGVLVRPNPGLRPERSRNDLEARFALRETSLGPATIAAQASAYRANLDGMIAWMPDYRFIWSPSNVDVSRSGWEVGGRLAVDVAALDLQGTLARSDVAYVGPVLEGQVPYRPRTTGSLTFAVSPRPVRLEIVNRYVGARRTVPGSAANALDPYWRTDARATVSLAPGVWRVDATLALDNLFDRPAYLLVDYPFPSRAWAFSLRLRRDRDPVRSP